MKFLVDENLLQRLCPWLTERLSAALDGAGGRAYERGAFHVKEHHVTRHPRRFRNDLFPPAQSHAGPLGQA
jgi:hypothetical protein